MAIRLKIFCMDIGALKVIVTSEVAPGRIPVCKYLKIKLIEEKRNTSFIRLDKIYLQFDLYSVFITCKYITYINCFTVEFIHLLL